MRGAARRYGATVTVNETVTAEVHKLVPILGAMGIEVLEAERGRASCSLPPGPNVNHFGVTYAGSLFSAAEMLGGLVSLASFSLEGFVPIVKGLDITFRRPATTTVRAEAVLSEEEMARVEAEAVEQGKAEFRLDVELTDESGEVVARTTGVYQLRRV